MKTMLFICLLFVLACGEKSQSYDLSGIVVRVLHDDMERFRRFYDADEVKPDRVEQEKVMHELMGSLELGITLLSETRVMAHRALLTTACENSVELLYEHHWGGNPQRCQTIKRDIESNHDTSSSNNLRHMGMGLDCENL